MAPAARSRAVHAMRLRRAGYADPWAPLGAALTAVQKGDIDANLVIYSTIWERETVAATEYYRPRGQPLPALERHALELCRGRVLDAGAGAGRHSLELQEAGLAVIALDIDPAAVRVMTSRGVADARCGDLMSHRDGGYDTILMLQNGAGVVGDIAGLGHLLERLPELLAPGGRLLLDSADLRVSLDRAGIDPADAAGSGGYLGEVEFRLEFRGRRGPWYPWLFVDFRTLALLARAAGLTARCLQQGDRGAYLAAVETHNDS